MRELGYPFTYMYVFPYINMNLPHVPHPEPSSLLHPHTIPLGRPSAPAPSRSENHNCGNENVNECVLKATRRISELEISSEEITKNTA